jgi:hypothetical protein
LIPGSVDDHHGLLAVPLDEDGMPLVVVETVRRFDGDALPSAM